MAQRKALALLDRSLARYIPGVPAISNYALTVGRTLTPAKDVHAALPTNKKAALPDGPKP